MKKQPELTAKTKQNLTDAFWELYCTKRIDKITVKEITKRAGYNRGTFYEYFVDVYQVLEQIETSLLPKPEEFPSPDLTTSPPPELIQDFIKTYEEHSKYYIVLLGDNGDPSFMSKMKNNTKPKLKQMLITKGAKDDFELDYTLEYLLFSMIGILSYWFKQENKPSKERLINLMYDIMQGGIMNKLSKL